MESIPRNSQRLLGALASWREALSFEKQQDEREFLPAALEIQASPPSPLGRAILWSILLFSVSAIAWASFGRIDIVATAPGQIIPAGHSKVIQPLETATVRAIRVQDGQTVEAGQILIELDTQITGADLKRLEQELLQNNGEFMRLQRQAQWATRGEADPEGSPDPLLNARWNEYQARLAALEAEREKTQAEHASTQRQVEKLQAILPLVSQRAEGLATLAVKKMVAEQQYLETEQQRLETQHDLRALEKKEEELQKGIQQVEARIDHEQKAFRSQTLEQLQEAQRRLTATIQELQKADTRNRAMSLTAPVAGRVQQLAVHSIGAVVTPAQPLLVIVPKQRQLEVEALLLNKDIGFVQEGQPAEIKVDAFNFTQYGVIPAQVIGISDDAVQDEKLGWTYKVKIHLERDHIRVKDKDVTLTPGMTVTAEIKTGDRKIIEFFLSPLLKGLDESVGER